MGCRLLPFRASGDQGLESKMSETIVTTEMAVRLTKQQAENIPNVGDIDLFGEVITEQDVVRSLESLARETEKRINLIGKAVAW
jgi:hypothetical protein